MTGASAQIVAQSSHKTHLLQGIMLSLKQRILRRHYGFHETRKDR